MKRKNKIKRFLLAVLLLPLLGWYQTAFSQPFANASSGEVADLLGWIADTRGCSRCGGYYKEPVFSTLETPEVPLTQGPINITFDQGEFLQEGTSVLSGKVVLTQPDRILNANKVYLTRDPVTGQWSTADLCGDVYLQEPGRLIIADKAHIKLTERSGWLQNTWYRFSLDPSAQLLSSQQAFRCRQKTTTSGIDVLNAWGRAERVEQLRPGFIILKCANYTTCPPLSRVWRLSSSNIQINNDTGRGVARNVVLRVKEVPIFYTPYFNFPIDKRRQTGFLFPSFGNTTSMGLTVGAPYYWNMAPNYDATITPNISTLRGFKLDGLFRYLMPSSNGQLRASIVPDDQEFARFRDRAPSLYPPSDELTELEGESSFRHYFYWKDDTRLNDHWFGGWDYSAVSDDYYFQDFGNTPAVVSTNQLLRQGNVNYQGQNWVFLGLLQSYQTLHPVNRAVTDNQYSSLPKLQLNGDFPDSPYGFDYQLNNELVYFTRSRDSSDTTIPPSATRVNIQPAVSYPLNPAEGYLTPTLQLAMTQYDIIHQTAGDPSNINRTLPIFNIDSGLFLDKNVRWFNQSYHQTLEPRLYYLYVPNKNQNDIPIFDTTIQPFDYDQLFRWNRFTGTDRIGDANQVAAAVTTRFLDQTSGEEKMRVSVGELFYFQERNVNLCNTPGCTDNNIPGVTSNTESVSPIAAQMDYHVNPVWHSTGNLAFDPNKLHVINTNVNFQYHPGLNKILNLGYTFVRDGDQVNQNLPGDSGGSDDNLSQPGGSFAWPLKEKWRMVGSYTYNLSHKHPQNYFYGLEYSSCCWAMRLVGSKTFAAVNEHNNPVYDSAIYFQVQLKGLGNIGTSDPSSMLVNSIPGYIDNFGQI